MPKAEYRYKTGNAPIKRQGHTKDSKGAFATNPNARSSAKGSSVDLKR